MRSQPETGVEPKAGEAGREVTLQQGLGTWIMEHRSGSSTPALVGEVCCGSNRQHHDRNLNRTDVIRIYRCSPWLCCGADGRHRRGSTTLARPLCDGHSPLATTPRADKTFGSGGNAEDHGERSIPRRAACIATCVGFILIPFSFALNP